MKHVKVKARGPHVSGHVVRVIRLAVLRQDYDERFRRPFVKSLRRAGLHVANNLSVAGRRRGRREGLCVTKVESRTYENQNGEYGNCLDKTKHDELRTRKLL